MHVLFLSDNFPPEGNAPATRLWEHGVRWAREGHKITVITCAPNFPEGRLFDGYENRWRSVEYMDGIRVVRVKTYITANEGILKRTLDYLSFMFMSFVMGLFERRPDVVAATSPQFFCALAGWGLSIVKWRPFVFELRDLWPASITAVGAMKDSRSIRLLEKLELLLYRRASAIVTVTNSFKKNLMERGISAGKIHVVRNGVDLQRYKPRKPDRGLQEEYNLENRFVVGYIGTHGLAHALPGVLSAAEWLKDHTDIAFVFAGSGADRDRVERIVAERGLHNVRLIPRQPKERMPALWSLCDIALVPLRDNPVFSTVIPSKIFEAMAMGIPLLTSVPEGEATSIVKEAEAGVCVPPETPRDMAESILEMAGHPDKLARMHCNALKAARHHSRDELSVKMIQVFESAIGRQ